MMPRKAKGMLGANETNRAKVEVGMSERASERERERERERRGGRREEKRKGSDWKRDNKSMLNPSF